MFVFFQSEHLNIRQNEQQTKISFSAYIMSEMIRVGIMTRKKWTLPVLTRGLSGRLLQMGKKCLNLQIWVAAVGQHWEKDRCSWKQKACLAKYFIIINEKTSKEKIVVSTGKPCGSQRSARVNKNSYKKPFTFPSYKIYLWGILPGKSLTETKDCLARMSWLGSIQNMWPVRDPRSCSQGLCSGVPWPLPHFFLPHDIYQMDSPPLSDHSRWPFGKHEKKECSVGFSFLMWVL